MPGIDPISVVRAGLASLTGSGDTGAATLEQQLAKNLYFPQNDGLVSKMWEAELALSWMPFTPRMMSCGCTW
jgi:membrane peptidoglycan carboxypeptidase